MRVMVFPSSFDSMQSHAAIGEVLAPAGTVNSTTRYATRALN
jgi:hypothetical protein